MSHRGGESQSGRNLSVLAITILKNIDYLYASDPGPVELSGGVKGVDAMVRTEDEGVSAVQMNCEAIRSVGENAGPPGDQVTGCVSGTHVRQAAAEDGGGVVADLFASLGGILADSAKAPCLEGDFQGSLLIPVLWAVGAVV